MALLSELSRCAWETLNMFLQKLVPEKHPMPGAVIAIQTFGDFLGFNPHLHVLCTDGCFYGKGIFRVPPRFRPRDLEEIFPHKVLKMLLSKGKITEDLIKMLMSWRHSGFNVFCGARINPGDEGAIEYLARYIIRASFSQERMTYIPEEAKVIYQSKDAKEHKIFDPLEWIAAMSLGRLWQQQGKQTEAHKLLGDIYGWFTEGFDTPDLKEAKALLEEFS